MGTFFHIARDQGRKRLRRRAVLARDRHRPHAPGANVWQHPKRGAKREGAQRIIFNIGRPPRCIVRN
jgi:hypothetical protein